jgi:integrase
VGRNRLGTAKLGDTKTGASMRPLSQAACDVLRSLTCSGELVFPATREAKRDEKSIAHKDANRIVIMSGFKKFFKRIATLGNLPPEATPHTLRHSFTSLAADLGFSETDNCGDGWPQGPHDDEPLCP